MSFVMPVLYVYITIPYFQALLQVESSLSTGVIIPRQRLAAYAGRKGKTEERGREKEGKLKYVMPN